ncbi:MAG: tRNA uridine-5-carboxymethylaminomethyl(34) synthesis GTPase MnmE [Opitutales bacterium]
MPDGDTIVAPATPTGESALALVRLSGPEAPAHARRLMRRPNDLPARRAVYGRFHDPAGDVIDDGIATVFEAGASYTGEAMAELSCHGNPLLVERLIQACLQAGCRLAEPGEFTRRAFLNGRIDLSQAEAVAELIQARSDSAVKAARRHLDGAVGLAIADFSRELLGIQAEVEAYIDFPEEDLPGEDNAGPIHNLDTLILAIRNTIRTRRARSLLAEGVQTVIVGLPNAGKSSLLNRLLGSDRAIVDSRPGTTRDYLREAFRLGPYCIQIMDTAGLREESDRVEAHGVARALELASRADCLLLVVDSTAPSPTLPEALREHLRPDKALVLENKCDLTVSSELTDWLPSLTHYRVSALTGQGIDSFLLGWEKWVAAQIPPVGSDALLVNARHAQVLERAVAALERTRRQLADKQPTELAATEMRDAQEAFGEVVGKVDNEAMLDELFQRFCIGK